LNKLEKLKNPKRDRTLTMEETKKSVGNELLQISGESESELPFNKGKYNIFTESQKL
jgi:hypothetical protein